MLRTHFSQNFNTGDECLPRRRINLHAMYLVIFKPWFGFASEWIDYNCIVLCTMVHSTVQVSEDLCVLLQVGNSRIVIAKDGATMIGNMTPGHVGIAQVGTSQIGTI